MSRILPYEKNVTGHPVIHWEKPALPASTDVGFVSFEGGIFQHWKSPLFKFDDWCLEIQELSREVSWVNIGLGKFNHDLTATEPWNHG